jgi:hypothetical protein
MEIIKGFMLLGRIFVSSCAYSVDKINKMVISFPEWLNTQPPGNNPAHDTNKSVAADRIS